MGVYDNIRQWQGIAPGGRAQELPPAAPSEGLTAETALDEDQRPPPGLAADLVGREQMIPEAPLAESDSATETPNIDQVLARLEKQTEELRAWLDDQAAARASDYNKRFTSDGRSNSESAEPDLD